MAEEKVDVPDMKKWLVLYHELHSIAMNFYYLVHGEVGWGIIKIDPRTDVATHCTEGLGLSPKEIDALTIDDLQLHKEKV